MTTGGEHPVDGVDPAEVVSLLLKPVADVVWAVEDSGSKLLAMLLRQEFQRGYTAGWRARALEHDPACPPDEAQPAAAPRNWLATDHIHLSRTTG